VSAPSAEAPPEPALRSLLQDLRGEAQAAAAPDLARAFEVLDEQLRSRRLLVAVIGEHNRGKSTVVNSLIGQAWLPMGQGAPALPPAYVAGGALEQVELAYTDGQRAESTRAELLTLSAEEAESIEAARVTLPTPDLAGLVLVDTPGLNDPDTARLTQTVYGLLPRADLALLVLDSAQALGASEQELLARHLAPAGLHRLVVILNRDDALENETQRLEVQERVQRMLAPCFDPAPQVLPYAARAALRARERADTRLLARSGYPELRALLTECARDRVGILHEAAARRAEALAERLLARLATPARVLEPPPDRSPNRPLAAARRAMQDISQDYRLQLGAFTLALRDRLPEEAGELPIEDIRRFLPFYIQAQFTGFLQEQEPAVRDRMQSALRAAGVADWPATPLTKAAPAPGLHPYIEPDFLEDSVLLTTFMTVAGLAMKPMVAAAVMTIGPLLRLLGRGLRERTTRETLLQAAMAATTEAGQAIEAQVTASFDQVLGSLRDPSLDPASQPSAAVAMVMAPGPEAARGRIAALRRGLDSYRARRADQAEA
jgi:hypothetical protein